MGAERRRVVSEFVVRDGTADDLPYIFDSWKSATRHQGGAHWMDAHEHAQRQHARIETILGRARVTVAHLPDTPTSIIGWAAMEVPETLHFVLVKANKERSFEGFGIARALLEPLGRDFAFTHWTRDFDRLLERWRNLNGASELSCPKCRGTVRRTGVEYECAVRRCKWKILLTEEPTTRPRPRFEPWRAPGWDVDVVRPDVAPKGET